MNRDITNCIFYTTQKMGWGTNWKVLKVLDVPITEMYKAKEFIRKINPPFYVGLATYEQMLLNNAQWDNM